VVPVEAGVLTADAEIDAKKTTARADTWHSCVTSDTLVNMKLRMSRSESQQVTRRRLIEAAERVFVRTGFDAAGVEEIAAEAGYSRGAFYSNFASKDALFLELADKKSSATREELGAIFREENDWQGRFAAAREWYANHVEKRRWTVIKAEFNLRALRSKALRKRLSALWEEELKTYAALLDQYFLEVGLTPGEDPRTIAVSLLATAQGLEMLSLHTDSVLGCDMASMRRRAFERLVPNPAESKGKTNRG